MHVFILGGTGLVGTRLVRRLLDRGDSVSVLTRRPDVARTKLAQGCVIVEGDPMQPGPWMAAVKDADAVINLVGEPVLGRRWNESLKALLRNSRVQSTAQVVKALALAPLTQAGRPKVLLNASAIGYYGPRAEEQLTEPAPPGDDELARLTIDWESTARQAEEFGIRVALLRIGVVLDPDGGALALMLPPFRLGLGGRIGSGRQWLSWIHHRDVVGILLLALDREEAAGPINVTSPEPVTNKVFTKALGRALHRPAFIPVPRFALWLRFGGAADVLTTGQRVRPERALALGYRFEFPQLDLALADVLGPRSEGG